MTTSELLQQESELLCLFASLTASAPDKALLTSIFEGLSGQDQQAFEPLEASMYDALKEALNDGQALLEIQKDYVNIFAGVKKRPDLPAPMQSTAQEGYDDITGLYAHLEGLFKKANFKPPTEHSHAPDHLSTLLYLLSTIRHHQAELFKSDNIEETHMEDLFFYTLKNHLLPWAPGFIDKAIPYCQSAFYRTVLGLILQFFKLVQEEN